MYRNLFMIAVLAQPVVDAAAQQAQIRVETAVRVKAVVDFSGQEQPCVHSEPTEQSCLLVKVSGMDPKRVQDIWIQETNGGVRVVAGDKQYRVSSVVTEFGNKKYCLLELTVPKGTKDFALVVGDAAPVPFVAPVTSAARVRHEDLLAQPKQK